MEQPQQRFQPGQHIHLIGIGGFGISAIARILLEQGYKVTGSDANSNALTEALARDGAAIYQGHDAAHVNGADMVIRTSAAGDDHIEVKAALGRGIPVYKRNDIIADLMADKTVIAVAGTHGKTTTTAMIVHILRESGLDPSYIVGGIMANTGTNAGVGQGNAFVIEADEYDNMFLGLKPNIIVLTSVEWDHPDFFKTESAVLKSFGEFIARLPESENFAESTLVACIDDALALKVLEAFRLTRRLNSFNDITFGIDTTSQVNCRALNIGTSPEGLTTFDFEVAHLNVGQVRLHVIGKHNIKNAMAALIASEIVGVMFNQSTAALETFKSTGRRFEIRGEVNGVIVVDDYAHHPTAIKTTLEGAKVRYPQHQVWAVWQPHTYSRTQALLDDYITAFASADAVLVTDIYAAREQPTPESITSAQVVAAMPHENAHHTPTHGDVLAYLQAHVESPAVIIVMSAGDGPKISQNFVDWMQDANSSA